MKRNPYRSRPITRHRIPSRFLANLATAVTLAVAPLVLASCDYEPPEIVGLDADSAFVLAVIPVLQDQCENCHFPGGPMHKMMPFDDMSVVGGLEDEVVTRLKGKGRERMAEWLAVWRREQAASERLIRDPH